MSDGWDVRLTMALTCHKCGMERTLPDGVEISCGCEGARYERHTPTPDEMDKIRDEWPRG